MLVSIILAAGAGTRVGGCKALLEIGGTPVLTRLLDATLQGGVDVAIVVTGAEAARVADLTRRSQVLTVENVDWQRGQTSSLQTALAHLPAAASAFLIHPVDHALVRAEHIAALVHAFKALGAPSRTILRPVHGSTHGHPVLFTADFALDFRRLGTETPANTVYRAHREGVVPVAVTDDACAFDLDTPEDLEVARRRVGGA